MRLPQNHARNSDSSPDVCCEAQLIVPEHREIPKTTRPHR
jgi:hypothetical protein